MNRQMSNGDRLSRKHLQILVGILAGHADLNGQLYITSVSQDSEDEDSSLHFIAQCSAVMLLWKKILRDYTL